jgi:hypothetical protein
MRACHAGCFARPSSTILRSAIRTSRAASYLLLHVRTSLPLRASLPCGKAKTGTTPAKSVSPASRCVTHVLNLKGYPCPDRTVRAHSALCTSREGVTAEEMNDYTWLRSEIEAEMKFAEWTVAGVLRHAEFVAVRDMYPRPP